ncbi:hypothetical protein BBO99_00002309 [Phytophthora kernoviae]|uniref:Uncharacterized protein n=1 Tax=Phytophthora kernoviae TaxID=325452 RepID=A0A421EX47_9STRA|nr:hypothetical protein JM16_001941 [Phytophthora kernoviae]RLN06783.1 hypothetical protein BBI17_002157 [Phytophthora kernoviae]RLN83221.1 hypothetical protein BBO99_00002309 [Phytophthora kernoviae]
MSLDESSVLMDRALVTMCVDLPESLGLYNTAKDQLSLAAIRAVPLLETVGPDSRKLALIKDWMKTYEPGEDQPLTSEIHMDSLKETDKRERKERARQQQVEKHALLTSEGGEGGDKRSKKKKKKKTKEKTKEKEKTKNKGTSKEMAKKQKSSGSKSVQKNHDLADSDDDVLYIEDSSSSSEESSSESSSDSNSDDNRGKKRKNVDEHEE